ncbi:DUF6705 family protein [Chryseobacterium sp. ISL-6]|uniref:DUF6705 family protein n=1 Tax=Chryseobacterium sp. ISL-6 TaxID=2819143 RepID=UPI001BE728A7|nr:DUF6705 family protein [Chryseobacterium sp. ISL-6]MBT2622441.1 hypothetical protein [Chryseobacterium sp. ISL-6]
MKKILILLALHFILLSCAQIFPLNTNTDVPNNSYIKDLNNELLPYEGTWSGIWNNKTFFLNLKRVKKYMDHKENNPYYKDVIVGRFKVLNSSGNILYDNTGLVDQDTKIEGIGFIKNTSKYTLFYVDPDICNISGNIYIDFVNTSNTQLNWKFMDTTDIIDSSCQYYNSNPFPQPLPKNVILTKQ